MRKTGGEKTIINLGENKNTRTLLNDGYLTLTCFSCGKKNFKSPNNIRIFFEAH